MELAQLRRGGSGATESMDADPRGLASRVVAARGKRDG
jgi:hypothetical protein